jgi:hypothetical protein
MTLDKLMLALAVVGLWLPGALLMSKTVRTKVRQQVRRQDEGLLALFRCRVNWVDLIRSGVCVWLVRETLATLGAGKTEFATLLTFSELGILLIAVLMQTIWFDPKPSAVGPLFFLTGLTLVYSGAQLGGFALALGLTVALMVRRLSATFLSVPIALAIFGYVFGRLGLSTIGNGLFFALPAFLAFAFGSRIAFVRLPPKSKPQAVAVAGVEPAKAAAASTKEINPTALRPVGSSVSN